MIDWLTDRPTDRQENHSRVKRKWEEIDAKYPEAKLGYDEKERERLQDLWEEKGISQEELVELDLD